MKILIVLSETLDSTVFPRYLAQSASLDTSELPVAINPFDEVALEAAARLQAAGVAKEVTALLIGGSLASLQKALAFGANGGIWIETEGAQTLSFLDRAQIAAALYQEEAPDLILLGKQTIDEDAPQMGQMIASLRNLPFVDAVSSFAIEGKTIRATSEVEGGQALWSLASPAVLGVDLCLNTPRFLGLKQMLAAKAKPIAHRPLSEFAPLLCQTSLISEGISEAPLRTSGTLVTSAEDLIASLRAADFLPAREMP